LSITAQLPHPLLHVPALTIIRLSGRFTLLIKTAIIIIIMTPNLTEMVKKALDAIHFPRVHNKPKQQQETPPQAAKSGTHNNKFVFDKDKVTVIFVLGGPGAGQSSFLSFSSSSPQPLSRFFKEKGRSVASSPRPLIAATSPRANSYAKRRNARTRSLVI
jgi:hypothetical protein